MGKLFDLHFEIGVMPAGQNGFYARTILNGPNGVIFEAVASTPAEAIAKVSLDLEASSMWGQIAQYPALAGYPFSAPVKPQVHIDPKAAKQRPSDIHNVQHPQCTVVCQAFDNFGDVKCRNICAHRKET